jgi:hypothetical protein
VTGKRVGNANAFALRHADSVEWSSASSACTSATGTRCPPPGSGSPRTNVSSTVAAAFMKANARCTAAAWVSVARCASSMWVAS